MQQAAKTHLPDFLGLDRSYQDHRGYLKVKKKSSNPVMKLQFPVGICKEIFKSHSS